MGCSARADGGLSTVQPPRAVDDFSLAAEFAARGRPAARLARI